MSAYSAPTEDITEFNTSLFNQPEETLSQAEADKLYLSKTKNDTSTATLTTFNGEVSVGGTLTGSSLIQSNTTSATTNKLFDNLFSGSTLAIGTLSSTNSIYGTTTFSNAVSVGQTLQSNNINGTINTGIKNLFSLLTGTLNIGQATTSLINLKGPTTFDLNTTFSQNVTIGTDGVANDLSIKGELRCYDTASPYTSYAKISTITTTSPTIPSVTYESPNIASSYHIFKAYSSAGLLTGSLFEINSTSVLSRAALILTNRLNFSTSTPYSFPFTSNTSLGYYLKATGTGTAVTSATPKTILTTATIPIGVWRIDFSVQNTITAGGIITQEQNYVSNILDGAIATAVPFTGSINRAHVNEVYATNDVQVITSSFTYNQSTAGVLYLNIVRTFGSGTYSFIGEIAVTRLA
jgi:hypothetical protein